MSTFKIMTDDHKAYDENGFVFLPALLEPEVISAFLSIMQLNMGDTLEHQKRFLSKTNLLPVDAYEIASAHFPFSLGLLWGLTPIMEKITRKKLLPSYAWGRIYPKGATCVVHNDRPSNEHSLNLTLGYSDDIIWDFCIGSGRIADSNLDHHTGYKDFGDLEYVRTKMKPGDAVAYQGQRHFHGRIDPNPNLWSAHLFLGWVDRDGPQKEFAFDKFELPPPAKFYFE